ncbi:heparinase II/III family protein [Enterococcus sp. JM9B]|uniref:heparinase II/III family protein n=1 Tax=Enterococcus sp. JM9B TaxID=1857216 RepID=UPI001374D654|nr:heparinase II/III family protein [Enterococcus sp. JM9B]KAF1303193.1 hypothetical protein BAU16_05325 [Enterococcus sp. JM9B]
MQETVNSASINHCLKAWDAKKWKEYLYREKPRLVTKDVTSLKVCGRKSVYAEDYSYSLKKAEELMDNCFAFTDPWDMERCREPHYFSSVKAIDWQFERNGDNEWLFMLNRHQYLKHLIYSYLLEGEKKYLEKFQEILWHWLKNEPFAETKSWSSWRSIEMGIRLKQWSHYLALLVAEDQSKNILSAEFLKDWITSFVEHCHHLTTEKNLAMAYTSNFKFLEMNGVFVASCFLREFTEAKDWSKTALEVLKESCQLQVTEDGFHWEQSFMYHHEVVLCLGEVVYLGRRLKVEIPTILSETLTRMIQASCKLTTSDLQQIPYGDSDEEELSSLFAWMAIVGQNPEAKWLSQRLSLDFLFQLGEEAEGQLQQLPIKEISYTSSALEQGGLFFLRDTYQKDGTYTLIKNGPHGGGHGHSDLLSLVIQHQGEMLLSDSGRFTYVEGSKARQKYKAASAHNTIIANHEDFTRQNGSWGFHEISQSLVNQYRFTRKWDYVLTSHVPYQDAPVYLQREVLFIKEGIWLIIDRGISDKVTAYQQFFNFPKTSVSMKKNQIYYEGTNSNLYLQLIQPQQIEVMDSKYSPEYNREKSAKRVVHSFSAEKHMTQFTLISLNHELQSETIQATDHVGKELSAPYLHIFAFEYKNQNYRIIYNDEQQPIPPRRVHFVEGVGITERFVLLKAAGRKNQWEKTIIKT